MTGPQFTAPHSTETLVKLLRAIAGGNLAKSNRHDAILNAAADRLALLGTLRGEVHRLALVIESAVRTADPDNHTDVVAVLKAVKKEIGS